MEHVSAASVDSISQLLNPFLEQEGVCRLVRPGTVRLSIPDGVGLDELSPNLGDGVKDQAAAWA